MMNFHNILILNFYLHKFDFFLAPNTISFLVIRGQHVFLCLCVPVRIGGKNFYDFKAQNFSMATICFWARQGSTEILSP